MGGLTNPQNRCGAEDGDDQEDVAGRRRILALARVHGPISIAYVIFTVHGKTTPSLLSTRTGISTSNSLHNPKMVSLRSIDSQHESTRRAPSISYPTKSRFAPQCPFWPKGHPEEGATRVNQSLRRSL